jgi:hypothetical protein
MRLLPISFGCTILVLLTTSGMAQTPESIPAGPAAAPITGVAPEQYGIDTRSAIAPWTIDTSSPVPGAPGETTLYGGQPSYIDPSCENLHNLTCNVYVDLLAYKLDRAYQQPIVLDASSTPPTPVLTTGSLDCGFEPGARTTFIYNSSPEEGTKIEMSYFGVYNWNSGQIVNGAGGGSTLQLPGNFGAAPLSLNGLAPNDFNSAASMAVSYQAQINSVEANFIYTDLLNPNATPGSPGQTAPGQGTSSPVSLLAGVRFIKMTEALDITSRRDPPGGVSVYDINSSSNLFGAQSGARYVRQEGCWELTATGKFGIYAGTLAQHTFQTNENNSVVERNYTPSFTQTSFVGEVNVALAYQFRKNRLFTFGYNALVLQGVARAPDSLDFSYRADSGNQLNVRHGAFMQGPSVGLEYRW